MKKKKRNASWATIKTNNTKYAKQIERRNKIKSSPPDLLKWDRKLHKHSFPPESSKNEGLAELMGE